MEGHCLLKKLHFAPMEGHCVPKGMTHCPIGQCSNGKTRCPNEGHRVLEEWHYILMKGHCLLTERHFALTEGHLLKEWHFAVMEGQCLLKEWHFALMVEQSARCPKQPTSQHLTSFISQRFSFPPVFLDEQDERARPGKLQSSNFLFVLLLLLLLLLFVLLYRPLGFVLFSVCLKEIPF
jgi:hypothetical protein